MADVRTAENDWAEYPNGEQFMDRLKEIGKSGIVKRMREEYIPSVEKVMTKAFKTHAPEALRLLSSLSEPFCFLCSRKRCWHAMPKDRISANSGIARTLASKGSISISG
jgi:hypothetical protein